MLLGISIFILYLFFVDFSKIIEVFMKVNLVIFSIAVLATLLDITFFAFTWHYLLRALSVKVNFFRSLSYVLVGILVDIIVPAESVSGEVSKIYLMGKDGEDVGKVSATLIIQRVYGMVLHAATLAIACICMFMMNYSLPSPVVYFVEVTIGLTLLFLALIAALCSKRELTWKFLNKIVDFFSRIIPERFNIKGWERSAEKILNTFYSSLSFLLKSPAKMLISIFSAISSWTFCLLISKLVFYSLGSEVPFIIVAIVYSLSMIIQSMPAGIPSEVGVTEIVMSSLYAMFGVPLSVSTAATILVRLLTVWLRCILGLIALYWRGVNYQKTDRRNDEC